MNMNTQSIDGTYNVFMHGKFTFGDNPQFREMILDKVGHTDIHQIVLHMNQVDFVDSAALGMLLLAHDETTRYQKPLFIQGISGQVKRTFEMARLHQFFQVQ